MHRASWIRTTACYAALTVGVILSAGCTGEPSVSPNATVYTADNPPPILHAPAQDLPGTMGLLDWLLVGKGLVLPGLSTRVAGGREELRFYPGSVSLAVLVTIHEADPSQVHFQLGPHGLLFGTPALLNISYRGTNADPLSSNYDGSSPALYYLNPNGIWEVVPGTNDAVNRIYSARLPHFSTYALGGASHGNAEW
jgi:hypothetical protein